MSEYIDNLVNELREQISSEELCCDGCKCILPSECADCSVFNHINDMQIQIAELLGIYEE